jgi:hypothetical protein
MDSQLLAAIGMQQKIILYAMRYEWIRTQGGSPFEVADVAWDSPESLDKAVDKALREQAQRRGR